MKIYVATVQIAMQGCINEDEACDAISEMLSEAPAVLDWAYVRINSRYLYPAELHVSDEYQEGDFLA